MVITLNIPHLDKATAVIYLLALNGLLAGIVKYCPTIPAKYPIIIAIIKILGKLTHNQTDDNAVRAKQEQAQNSTQTP